MSPEEAVVNGLIAELPPALIEQARSAFEARTGAFSSSDPFHEERMRAFSDELVCSPSPDGLPSPAARALERAGAEGRDDELRGWLLALVGCERGLFRVEQRTEDEVALRSLLGDAPFRVSLGGSPTSPAARLRPGDVFDGRLAPVEGSIRLLAGMVFHPEQAHASILAIVPAALARGVPHEALLDSLLRMRMRHDRFTSMHARHVYRLDALDTREIQAASWTNRRAGHP